MTANADVKKALNALNERRVIETGGNSDAWYRKWSDGWVEQGGIKKDPGVSNASGEITLQTPFSNTNYVVFFTAYNPDWTATMGVFSCRVREKERTKFGYFSDAANLQWYACGF